MVLQPLPKPHSDLPNVPLAVNFAKTEEARELIQVGIHNVTAISRPFVLPPRTPKERVQLLRKAFTETMNDPEFRADAEKYNLDLSHISVEGLDQTVHRR